ncbi:MAG TPA: ABC-2 family transporter protein [Clostridia bacterium]|nr:ABC-2 family transporter protein [Clostridia bacterium]
MAVEHIKRAFRLLALYARMDAAWLLRDTRNCILAVVSDLVSNLASISSVFLLSQRFAGVGALSSDEILLMLGYSSTLSGLFQLFFGGGNAGYISRRVGRGQLDHMLIQPLPLSAQLLTEGFLPVSGSGVFVSGIAVVAIAAVRLNLALTFGWVLLLLCYLVCGVAIVLGYSFLAGSTAFYRPKGGEELSSVAIDALFALSIYPLSGLPALLRGALLTVLPTGIMAWLPTCILLNKTEGGILPLLPALVAVTLCGLAYIFFSKGLKHYAKTGSSRYRSVGHRS